MHAQLSVHILAGEHGMNLRRRAEARQRNKVLDFIHEICIFCIKPTVKT